MTTPGSPRYAAPIDDRLRSIQAWQDRFRDPGLTVLLVVQLCLVFLAEPLAAKGLPIARQAGEALVLAVVVIVVILSRNRGAIPLMALGMAAILASFSLGWALSPITISVLRRGGDMVSYAAVIWVVARAVFAPGRITSHRLQGAVVVYLNIATIFSAAFTLIWELSPTAFVNFAPPTGELGEMATMLYFSLTTLTTTGYGDIVPVDPFARSLANLESVLGQFYLAITVARLVTLELGGRRR